MWAAIKNNIKINTELFKHKKWPCQEIICVTLLIVDEHTRTHTYNWHPTCLKRNSQSVAADVTADKIQYNQTFKENVIETNCCSS